MKTSLFSLPLETKRGLLREAVESTWFLSFMDGLGGKYTPEQILPILRETIVSYLTERLRVRLEARGMAPSDEAETLETIAFFQSLANEAVIVRPRHRDGTHAVVGRWQLSELGDTHDGEYELAAG